MKMPLPMAVQSMQASVAAYQGAAEPMDVSDDGGDLPRDLAEDHQVFNPTMVNLAKTHKLL